MKNLKIIFLMLSIILCSEVHAMKDLRSLHPNMNKIAQGLLAQEDTITARKLIGFLKSLPYTANALDVVSKMAGKSHLVQDPTVVRWCNAARKSLKSGALLRAHCWMPTETEKIELLLKRKNLDLNSPDLVIGMTPLFIATFNRHTPLAMRLIKMGANPNIEDTGIKCTPLWLASTRGNFELVRELLDAGAEIKECDVPHLQYLGYNSAADILKAEERKRKAPADQEPAKKNVDKRGFCMKNSKNIFLFLSLCIFMPIIGMEAPPAQPVCVQDQVQMIFNLVTSQAVDAPTLLVRLKSFPYTATAVDLADRLNKRKPSLMRTPSVAAWHKAAKASLESGPELYKAVSANNKEAVRKLFKEKTNLDFNWQNDAQRKRSVLALASVFGRVEIVGTLLQAGANPNIEDSDGCTPLWEAAYNGEWHVVEKLVAAGARIDKIVQQRTIIEWTQRRGFVPLAAYLEEVKKKQSS